MAYFITSGPITGLYPLAFNTATPLTSAVTAPYSKAFTAATYNENGFSVTQTGLLLGLSLVGRSFIPTGGTGVSPSVINDPLIIVTQNQNRVTLAQSLGAAASLQNDITGTMQVCAFGPGDLCVLRGIGILTAPTVADTVTLIDKTGATIITFSVPANAVTMPPFSFPMPIPAGGFGVTTNVSGSVYQFIFDWQGSIQ
jgi:hypothetical protein